MGGMTGREHEDLAERLGSEFEILRPLGRGSVGTVYLAREVSVRRLVAIKVPHPELARDAEVRARLVREARAAARIAHPGAATLYRTGELSDGVPYLVMQYVEGRTCDDALAADGSFDLETGLSIVEQVARALAAAHAQGVVHRDLRPENVMWNAQTGRAVLTDFGIAGILETGSEVVTQITRVGQTLGKVEFSSPEQLRQEKVTEATDVYSLGLLTYWLLAAEGPYEGTSNAEKIRAHLQEPPRPLRELVPAVPAPVAELVEQCLEKVAARRPRAERVARVLGAARTGEAVPAATARGPHADAGALPAAIREFIAQVRRRRVGDVAIGYLIVAFVLLGGMEVLLPGLPLPEETTYRVVVAALAAGFPLALVVSWIYDITTRGIERTATEGPVRSRGWQVALQAVAVVLSLALSAGLAYWILG